jgi:PAS domain S-box-containing protein
VTVNERFAEIIGAVLADIEPLSASAFTALIHPDDRASMQAVVEQPHDGRDQPFDIRMRLAHRGGGWVWVQNRGRVLDWDEHDRPLRLAGALQDVSVEVEREQALRAAKEQAEASERKKSEWLANVSHEVRTPLNSVLGLVQLMQEWSPDDRQGEALARIVESAHLLRQTLDDLLDNAKLEAGQLVLEQVPLDLSELSRSVMAVFTHKAQESGVDLICRLAAEVPPHVLGDPLRLRQVINNLVANALKFTSRGSIEVRLGGHDNALGSTYELLVEVVDTGSGIAPEHLSQLFKPYYQADASTTRRFGGTGLGLSIAQRLVRLMGGRIGVDSQPGRGSRFWFTVPLALAEPSDIEADRPPNRLRAQRWSSTDYAQTKPEDAAEPVTAEGAAAELGLGSEDAHLWRALRESLVLQEHRALELCQRLIEQSDAGRATVLRKVLRHARNFNFEAALGELPKSQETSL